MEARAPNIMWFARARRVPHLCKLRASVFVMQPGGSRTRFEHNFDRINRLRNVRQRDGAPQYSLDEPLTVSR